MKLHPQTTDLSRYRESSELIDFRLDKSCEINALTKKLLRIDWQQGEFTSNAFAFVRDKIAHSMDIKSKVVTCKASEVLSAKEGLCYAKSHLLAAILRCSGIPTGFCYQRLMFNNTLVLHGLNAVYIKSIDKWIRLDARGNKPGVDAQFSLYSEKLAYTVRPELGEEDIPIIFAEPNENVVRSLTTDKKLDEVVKNLPRILN